MVCEKLLFFRGVPQELLFDNAKALMLERDAYGEGRHRGNPTLLALADEFGLSPERVVPTERVPKAKSNAGCRTSLISVFMARQARSHKCV